MITMVTIEPRTKSSSISHSFTGEHVEDGSDEKADTQGDHCDIEHAGHLRPTSLFRLGRAAAAPEPESGSAGAAKCVESH